jgi:hypothetical protein
MATTKPAKPKKTGMYLLFSPLLATEPNWRQLCRSSSRRHCRDALASPLAEVIDEVSGRRMEQFRRPVTPTGRVGLQSQAVACPPRMKAAFAAA